MKIFEYLRPENPIAQWIVLVLIVMFAFWCGLLVWSLWRHLLYRGQIRRCKDVSPLRFQDTGERVVEEPAAFGLPESDERIFRTFQRARGLHKGGPISNHLRAIFDAGRNESQLDARGLIKNTTDELFRINTLHRSLLSIFIILGLLGTLFGLADTMASLDTLLRDTAQLNNVTLSQSLRVLLGTLKGAFAPSIWGVSLTVLGVLLFSFYLRLVALPLGGLLERTTLTVWIPRLIPTASQKLLESLLLSERQMQRSFDAAQKVAKFAESIEGKTGAFAQTLDVTTDSLRQIGTIAEGLQTFSENFRIAVSTLAPFQEDLGKLYNQMVAESRAFQESVRLNIAGAEGFQEKIQAQLNSQNQQLVQVLSALQTYEATYRTNSGKIDEKFGAVLVQAGQAFQSLGERNEEIRAALESALGKPLRDGLSVGLGSLESKMQERLGEVKDTLIVQLSSLGDRLRQLDVPLNNAATNFKETFENFNEHTSQWRKELQQEFTEQNKRSQRQLERLDILSEQLPPLLEKAAANSADFSESGQQLSQSITSLGLGVDALNEQVSAQASLVALLTQVTSALRELRRMGEGQR
jgi:hypothetical protein